MRVDEKRSYLIDAGNGIEAINALQPNQNIDAVFFNTCTHYDHIAHIGDVIENFPIVKYTVQNILELRSQIINSIYLSIMVLQSFYWVNKLI